MKKNVFLKILFVAIMCCITTSVKAYYNGGGGFSITGSYGGSACTSNSRMCYNKDYFFLQARLFYVDNTGGKFEWSNPYDAKGTCQGTYFFADSKSANYLKTSLKVPSDCVYNMEGQTGTYNGSTVTWNAALISDGSRYAKASAILRHYFGDDVNRCKNQVCTPNDNLKKFLNFATAGVYDTSNTYASKMTKDSQTAVTSAKKVKDGATKGYRVIIEPALMYNYPEKILATPKQVANKSWASYINQGTRPLTKGEQIQYLYTDFADVGIDYGSHAWCADKEARTISDLADWKIGCGMNIIDVGKYVDQHYCYIKKEKVTGSLTCVNYDKNNEATFTEYYSKEECTAEKALKNTNTEYGKKISETNNCTLYCIESAFASLPGGIKNAREIIGKEISPGSYFAWPARYGSSYGMKMQLKSSLKCTIVAKSNKTCSSSDITTLHDKARGYANEKLNFGAYLTGGSNKPLTKQKLNLYNTTTTLTNSDSKTFTLNKSTYLEIPENKNRYVNKATGETSDTKTGAFQFDRKEGVISLKIDEEAYKQYNLEISDVTLGEGNKYGKKINNYVCKYTLEDSCTCPPEYYDAGRSLTPEMEELGLSCLEAQEKFCKCQCPSDSSCGEEGKDLSDKITEQTSKACKEAQEKYCYHTYCKTSEGKKVDITGCINEQMAKGRTKGEAANICEDKYCPGVCGNTCVDKHGKTIDISACINEGHSYQICYYRYCSKIPCINGICNYACTENCKWSEQKKGNYIQYIRTCSNNEDGEDCGNIRIPCVNGICNQCVVTKLESKLKGASILNGLNSGKISQADLMGAIKACYNDKGLPKIVYRTIDLNNPFPGKSGAARYQGYNWDSKKIINAKILNGRGEKGEALYNKTPLYTITLTPETIKQIKKYNKEHDYSDFTLQCKSESGSTACISSFVHNANYVKIDTKNSVAKCYNLNSTKSEWDFVNCYEMNN